jgi:hypothetical protein
MGSLQDTRIEAKVLQQIRLPCQLIKFLCQTLDKMLVRSQMSFQAHSFLKCKPNVNSFLLYSIARLCQILWDMPLALTIKQLLTKFHPQPFLFHLLQVFLCVHLFGQILIIIQIFSLSFLISYHITLHH